MSHSGERNEKNCLNCNAVVYGRYCHICGQENVVPKDTFGHLVAHFVSDIFHFDGKFFSSCGYLLFKPGFLTYEYVRGRRASYLNPIKMTVFISAVFFLLFFWVLKPENLFTNIQKEAMPVAEVREALKDQQIELEKSLADATQPALLRKTRQTKLIQVNSDIALLQKDTTAKAAVIERMDNSIIDLGEGNYTTIQQYDSVQQSLPPGKRDNWLMQKMQKRNLAIRQKYNGNNEELSTNLGENFLHHFPQMMFISLPLFALILQLLYARHKRFYYVDHIIYTVHLYCAAYVFIFLLLLLSKAAGYFHLSWLIYIQAAIVVYILFYSYKAMRSFYGQWAWKTGIKWILLNLLAYLVMIFLFILILILSVFTF